MNTIVCFDLPDFKERGETSSHPRHSDNKLHRGRASGTPSEGKLHEHEQTCHSDCPVIPSLGCHKELAAEALSLHFLSTRGAWWEPSSCYLSGKATLYIIIFSTQTGKPWGIIFFINNHKYFIVASICFIYNCLLLMMAIFIIKRGVRGQISGILPQFQVFSVEKIKKFHFFCCTLFSKPVQYINKVNSADFILISKYQPPRRIKSHICKYCREKREPLSLIT